MRLQPPSESFLATIDFFSILYRRKQVVGRTLRCEEPENIFFVFRAEICPHPHMANHSAGNRWRQLLREAMTSTAIRVEFALTHVRLFHIGSFRRRFSSRTGRLRRG